MASVYTNDLRLEEIGSGEQSGTWGDTTNTNLELIAEAFGYGTEAITTNQDTHTTTIADGAASQGRHMYLKYTGTLDSACTITLTNTDGTFTVSKLWFIENATSGSQNIIITSGSGADVTIAPGTTKVVYTDGAGSGGAVIDAFASLSVVDLIVDDDLTITDDLNVGDDILLTSDSSAIKFGAGADATLTHTNDVGLTLNGTNKLMFNDASQFIQGASATVLDIAATDTIELTATTTAIVGNQTVSGTLISTGKITADAGIDIDNFNIDGTTIALSSGDMILDAVGRIDLSADDNGEVKLLDGSSNYGRFKDDDDRFRIESMIQDKAMMFVGNDGGSEVTALSLNMSAAGAATFNAGVTLNGNFITTTAGSNNFRAGSTALDSVQSGGNENIAIGDNALTACTTGDSNIAIGYNTLKTNETNINNIGIGNGSLEDNTGGSNIGIGVYAAHSNTSGVGAICIGHYAGIYATGAGNIAIGYLAGYSQNSSNKLQTGYGNVMIGNQVSVAASDDYSCIVIGGGTGKGDTTGFLAATGGIYQGNNNASWSTTSDKRLKKNIVDCNIGLEEINKIKVREFEYRTEEEITELDGKVDKIDKQGVQVGVIAQEIQEILPKCVKETSQGVLSVEPDNITWHLVKALQELSAKNDALEARLVTLEGA